MTRSKDLCRKSRQWIYFLSWTGSDTGPDRAVGLEMRTLASKQQMIDGNLVWIDEMGGGGHGHAAPFDNGHKSPLGSNNFTPPLGWWKAFRQMTSGEGVTKKWCVIEITADLITAHKRQSSFYDVVAVWTLLERLSTTKRWFFFSSKLRNEWKIDEYCGKNPKLNYNCGLVELAAISRIFFFLISNEIIPLIF